MATLDCGTCNFGGDDIFVNTENTIIEFANRMNELGIKPEVEVFDKGMIDMAIRLNKKGIIKSPMHFDFVMGVNGGISGTASRKSGISYGDHGNPYGRTCKSRI